MFNTLFGFSGRLRRRDFILWSILVPVILILPPVVAVASAAADKKTGLVEDLVAAGMLWPFFAMIVVSNYVSIALFWKRMNDVDEQRQQKMWAGFTRWSYAIMVVLNCMIVGLNLLALGKLEGSAAGLVVLAFWKMACWLSPHRGGSSFGPDPREGSRVTLADADEPSEVSLTLDAAMQRALAERSARATQIVSPKLSRPVKLAPSGPPARPSFGKR